MQLVEEKDERFCIKVSTIPEAGMGCFARVPLAKGDCLEVAGVYVKEGSAAGICTFYANAYKFAGSSRAERDNGYSIVPLGYGGMINHSDDPARVNCAIEHVRGLPRQTPKGGRGRRAGRRHAPTGRPDPSRRVVWRFTRDIAAGEEMIGGYGPDYARTLRFLAKCSSEVDRDRADLQELLDLDLYNLGVLRRLDVIPQESAAAGR